MVDGVSGFAMFFIKITQVGGIGTASNGNASVDYIVLVVWQVADDEVHAWNLHIAVEEQQPGISAMVGKVVAGGSTASVLFLAKESAVAEQ